MSNKPEPIIVQMESISPEPITMGSAVDLKHDWHTLLNTSPFQKYCSEQSGNSSSDIESWLSTFVENEILNKGEDSLFVAYSTWHKEIGYWKNEDVYGNLLIGDH